MEQKTLKLFDENKVHFYNTANVSEYGLKNGFLDYRGLMQLVGDAILCNNIASLTHKDIYMEIVKGDEYIDCEEFFNDNQNNDNYYTEIFQYYLISNQGAEVLQALTNEIVYYVDELDLYVWGVTHYGTAWDYVLTDIKLEQNGEEVQG